MKHFTNFDLTDLNTFHIKAFAKDFFLLQDKNEIPGLVKKLKAKNTPPLILGSGSNVLFANDPTQPVIKYTPNSIHILEQHEDYDLVEVEAGMIWDDFVRWSVQNNYYGLVNLSYIPGTVGAAPVQNIGAYGQEAKDFIHTVNYFNIHLEQFTSITNSQCNFGYRTSIFKQQLRNKAFITSVVFRLPKKQFFNLSYRDLHPLKDNPNLSLLLLRLTIGKIRMSKLPDPSIIGNAGSFFKNPIITQDYLQRLIKQFPHMPYFTMPGNKVKIPAGWLIDNLGLKGYRLGDAGVYEHNALVLVNHGKATGKDILKLATHIQSLVKQKYNITLQPEVNIIQ